MNREATIYSLYNIKVDETSSNVAVARDRALRKGQRIALEQLFRRIILKNDREKLPTFKDNEVVEFISGFEINEEKRSSVRYIASLVVHFNRSKINDVLSFYKIPFAETLGTSVSVLPVLEKGGAILLWEEGNGWLDAWHQHDVIHKLVPIGTPFPTLKNKLYISGLQARTNNQKLIETFISENRINDLIIAYAVIGKNLSAGKLTLDIELKRNSLKNKDDSVALLSVSVPYLDETEKLNYTALFKAGVDVTTDWVDDSWKSKVLVSYGSASTILVKGNLLAVDDWLFMQKQLAKVNLVRKVSLKGISTQAVDLEIEFAGGPEQLSLSLEQQGLSLEKSEKDQVWIISLGKRFGGKDNLNVY
ncbi:MAG: DUF2066 domain-containing protein [Emcibacteraceae bacterium]|nr:DUF2066 domain-containing protein [Emcibacteraceae bacterium]